MKTIGNVLWFIFSGLEMGLCYCLLGMLWCLTIVGIPFGTQCFKLAGLIFWPFGRKVYTDFGKHPFANVIWLIFGGLIVGISFFAAGILWCVTIVGIPFGKQCFKLARLSLTPFGAVIWQEK